MEISPSVNYQAMGMLVQSLFSGRILKISFHEDQKNYVIRLSKPADTDKASVEKFEKKTGWHLSIEAQEPVANIQSHEIMPEAGHTYEDLLKNVLIRHTGP